MKLGEFLNQLGQTAGIDKSLINDLLENETVANSEVNDEFANQLNGNILTVDSAKHNPNVRNHYFAQFNNGIDTMIGRYADGLPDEIKEDVLGKEKTTQRISSLIEAQNKLIEEARKSGGKGDSKELADKIAELNQQIVDLKSGYETEKTQLIESHSEKLRNMRMKTTLGTYQYSDAYDRSDAILLAENKVQNRLREKGLKLVDVDGNLSLQTSEGQDYYENNQKVAFEDFTKDVLAESKLLKVQQSPGTPPTPPAGGAPSKGGATSTYRQKIEDELAAQQQ